MLRLRAETPDDLAVMSALVQDALVRRSDIHFQPRAQRLVLLVQRYRWEADGARTRVRSALQFAFVRTLRQKSLAGQADDAPLDLLALRADDATTIYIDFAGGPALHLIVDAIDVVLEDLTSAWPTRLQPAHPDELLD